MGKRGPRPGSTFNLQPHDTVAKGDAIGVLLSNLPARVWVDREDYRRIVQAHGNRAWSWVEAARYVRLRVKGNGSVPVARLVLESDCTGFVNFADGDRLNLRRANLSITAMREDGGPPQPSSSKRAARRKEVGSGLTGSLRPPPVPQRATIIPKQTHAVVATVPRTAASERTRG